MITEQDRIHLQRCVELAAQALASGDEPTPLSPTPSLMVLTMS